MKRSHCEERSDEAIALTEILFHLSSVSGGYGGEAIVRDVSLEIRKGDFLGILGPNGSGKSTLLRLMTRVLAPTQGRILFEGRDLSQWPLGEFCRRTAFVPQEAPTAFPFTVGEMALMGRTPHLNGLAFEGHHDHAAVKKALSLTDLLPLRNRRIDELSAGERQRAIVARALAQGPAALLGDEPTSHLDIGHQVRILDLMKTLCRGEGLTVVLVLHDLNMAAEYCDRIALLADGRIMKEGSPREALTREAIESVYKTPVVVDENPATGHPRVSLSPCRIKSS